MRVRHGTEKGWKQFVAVCRTRRMFDFLWLFTTPALHRQLLAGYVIEEGSKAPDMQQGRFGVRVSGLFCPPLRH